MANGTCEYVGSDQKVCGEIALICSKCPKAYCPKCYEAHHHDEHSVIPELNIEPDAPPAEAQVPAEPVAPKSPFDPLFVSPPADKPLEQPVPAPEEPEEPEESIPEEKVGEMFSAEMGRVVEALDKLSKRGLNQMAVIALIHDAEPKIPKSTIAAVLRAFRQLPDLYGRKRPGRKSQS